MGLPIGITMGLVGFVGIWVMVTGPAALAAFAHTAFNQASSYDMSTLPLFLLMAEVVFRTGFGKSLYDLARAWLGHFSGGLAMATVGACAGFAAVSSSNIATAATFGLIALPEMEKNKYDPRLATGCVAAGGTLGMLIPPSAFMILYGILTETSIGKLFTAGLIPGIIQAIFYLITISIVCRLNPTMGPPERSRSLKERIMALRDCWEMIALIVLVLGGLIFGLFTPPEAGAVGAFGALALSIIRRKLNWNNFREAILGTMKTTGMIYLIVIGAMTFKTFIAISTLPYWLAETVGGLNIPPVWIIACIVLLYIILGTAMEELSMMVLTIPIFFPLVMKFGFDPIWFGIICTKMICFGMITPPMGMTMFVVQGISKQPITTVYKGVLPFCISDVVHTAVLLFIPEVSLLLPKLLTW